MKKILFALFITIFLVACTVEQPKTETVVKNVSSQPAQETAQAPVTAPKVECSNDEDCGGRVVSSKPYCFQGQVHGTYTSNRCVNPGTTKSYCVSETKTGLIQECPESQFCRQGECLSYKCNDSDGGKDYADRGEVTLNDGNVYEDYCKDSSTLIEYYCSSDNRQFFEKKTCDCNSGACEPGRNY